LTHFDFPNFTLPTQFKKRTEPKVQDENKNTEYLCLSYNPFADVIAVGLDNGNIKLYDEHTLQVTSLLKKSIRQQPNSLVLIWLKLADKFVGLVPSQPTSLSA
jgi:hypothetical protein